MDHRPSRMSACTRSTATRPPLPNMREELTTDQPPLLVFGINCEMKEAMEMLTKLEDRLEMLLIWVREPLPRVDMSR